jgi:hypothetical protein
MILESYNCNLTSLFGIITLIWLAFSLSRYKWYQSNLITPCDARTLYDLQKFNLSGEDCDLQKVNLTLNGWVAYIEWDVRNLSRGD